MVLNASAYWVIGLLLIYYFAFKVNMQGIGLWIGLCSGVGLSTILLYGRFLVTNRLATFQNTAKALD